MASSNATPPDDEEWSIFENNANYYKILGVRLNATECDIKQAYRSKAKQLHPDRHPHINDELFKNLAKAYEVLSDSVKRTEYNEKIDDSESDAFDHKDPVGSLLSGPRMSECWRKHYHESLKLRDDCGIMNFMDALNKKMDEFQKEQFSYLVCTSKRKQASQEDDCQEDVSTDICDEMMNSVHEAIHSSDTLKSTEEHNGALQKVIYRMQTTSSEVKSVGSNVPILDFECLDYSDVLILLSHFVSEEEVAVLRKLKRKELIEKMVPHVPEAKVRAVPDSEESTQCKKCKEKFVFFFNPSHICKPCGNVYCKKCVPHKIKYPRYGIMKSIPTCEICFQSNAQLDEDDWQELGIASLKTGAAETLWKAMGCFTMALHCSTNSFGTMSRLAEELLSLSLIEMVLPILSVLLQITQEEKEKRSIYLLLSNLTLRLASESNTCWDSKHLFLKISKQACSKASKASSSNNDLRIDKMFQEIRKATTTFNDEMQNYHTNLVLAIRESL